MTCHSRHASIGRPAHAPRAVPYFPDSVSHQARLLLIDVAHLAFLREFDETSDTPALRATRTALARQAAAIIGKGCAP